MNNKNKEKASKNKYLIYLLIAAVLILVISTGYVYFLGPVEVRSLLVKFSVGNVAGIDINGTVVSFGMMLPASKAVRSVSIENNHPFPIEITPFLSDSVAQYIKMDKNVTIPIGSSHTFPIELDIPQNMPKGSYQGKIVFVIKRAN